MISESLKTNTTLSELNLWSDKKNSRINNENNEENERM